MAETSENHPRKREGKTRKDLASGAKNRNYQNKVARASWQNQGGAFPYESCNGKRNRVVFTGKGNTQVRLVVKSSVSGKRK